MLKVVRVILAGFIITAFAGHANAEIFGRDETKYEDIRDFKKWQEVIKKNEMDMIVNNQVTAQWKEAIAVLDNPSFTRAQKIAGVNQFINAWLVYNNDSQIWGRNDYWASPTESFTRGTGDCEDYAAAKYFSLKMLGFKDDEMRLVILKDTRKNELHAVLAVDGEEEGRSYVLDNQNQNVLMDSQIAYYSPIYSINERNWWKNS